MNLAEVKPNTEEAFLDHLKSGGWNGQCLVCGEKEPITSWTDYNGQVYCHTCGETYQILGSHLRDEFLEAHNLKKEDVPKAYSDSFTYIPLNKAYWEETKDFNCNGMWLCGTNPTTKEQRDKMICWLKNNAEVLRKNWEKYLKWDEIMKFESALA